MSGAVVAGKRLPRTKFVTVDNDVTRKPPLVILQTVANNFERNRRLLRYYNNI